MRHCLGEPIFRYDRRHGAAFISDRRQRSLAEHVEHGQRAKAEHRNRHDNFQQGEAVLVIGRRALTLHQGSS